MNRGARRICGFLTPCTDGQKDGTMCRLLAWSIVEPADNPGGFLRSTTTQIVPPQYRPLFCLGTFPERAAEISCSEYLAQPT